MLKNKLLLLLLFSLLFWSCDKTVDNSNTVIWGETDYYSNFLFKKYEPIIMTQTLVLEFNEDAKRLLKNNIVFEIVEKNGQEMFVNPKYIKIYKNRVLCKDNTLKIKPNVDSIELGIEFTEKAPEGNHTLYLRVKNGGGLDRIDDTDLSSDEIILAHEWVVKKDNIYNPLAKSLFWVFIVVLVIFIILIIFIRANNPIFRIRKLQIAYYTPKGELIPPYENIQLKGCYKVICSNKKQKQSMFSRLFKGKTIFVVNDFWDKEICLMPKSFSKNSIRIVNNPYDLSIKSILKGTPTEFFNNSKEKVIFKF